MSSLLKRSVILSLVLASAAFADTRRVAIVVGNNAGGPSMLLLRFAESDAGKMACSSSWAT